MWSWDVFIPVLLIGAFAGFWAGLLGVGGGLIIVPIVVWLLHSQHLGGDHVQHLAVGTSFAVMVFTSLSSVLAQQRRRAVRWDLVWRLAPWMMVGVFLGSKVAAWVPSHGLQIFFVFFALVIAIQTLLDFKPKPTRQMPGKVGSGVAGGMIGALSSWVGIGGGALSIPFMLYCNVPVINATGTSAALGWPIALAGAIGYMVSGWSVAGLPEGSLGFVFTPAVLALAIGTVTCAPLGVKVAHQLPPRALKIAFAVMLLLTAAQMAWRLWFAG